MHAKSYFQSWGGLLETQWKVKVFVEKFWKRRQDFWKESECKGSERQKAPRRYFGEFKAGPDLNEGVEGN